MREVFYTDTQTNLFPINNAFLNAKIERNTMLMNVWLLLL
jgi:hypothetical protein